MMRYTAEYFRKDMPEWKKKKDPIFARFFYRPVSFYISAICANMGIKANVVTIFSVFVALIAALCFYVQDKNIRIIGAILISIWLLLDCVDGNLARSVNRQPFGEFLDALGSYVLVAFLGLGLGISVFNNGGVILEQGNYIWIVLGGLVSILDILMRLTYQKYRNNSVELQQKGIIPVEIDKRVDHNSVTSIRTRIEMELGICGILPPAIIICVFIGGLDLILLYLFLFNLMGCTATLFIYVIKTIKYL